MVAMIDVNQVGLYELSKDELLIIDGVFPARLLVQQLVPVLAQLWEP